MQNDNTTTVNVKVEFLGEFKDFDSWIKHVQVCAHKFGVNSKLLHLDSNGYMTTGYDLKNINNEDAFPVKSYLMLQSPKVEKPLPYKSNSNK